MPSQIDSLKIQDKRPRERTASGTNVELQAAQAGNWNSVGIADSAEREPAEIDRSGFGRRLNQFSSPCSKRRGPHVTPAFKFYCGCHLHSLHTMSTKLKDQAVSTAQKPAGVARATHPFRVYGYKVTHEWIWKFGRDRDLEEPDMDDDSLESAVFLYLMLRLPGLQRHFLDDPSDTTFGYSHCLSIANNWDPKKKLLVAGRLPQWKTVLGIEEEPRWYIPTRHTTPSM